ncbi:MAG: glycine cleavage system aminomethyltransferase GcvT [Sediminibacterium sp.]|nr:glycine cleavage system aminomethyltransferase GcvT [Sediminibacterium sp.]
MLQTPFHQFHIDLKAKMANFAGYDMPIYYSGLAQEHVEVRNRVGVFDVSHMGEFLIKGAHALELIQKVCTNDANKLKNGKAQYSCFTNENGGILDDLLIYCIEYNALYLLVVNASRIEADWAWINKNNTMGAALEDISINTALLAIQGPQAIELLAPHCNFNLKSLPYYQFVMTEFLGIEKVLISNTGYTGAGGVEIYFRNESQHVNKIWNFLREDLAIAPIGLGARDSLRLEKGFSLYGHEINEDTNPLEAGLGWIVNFNKDFIGKESLQNIKQQGLERKIVGLKLNDMRFIPRQGFDICNAAGNKIGTITSGGLSHCLKLPIALGYVPLSETQIDNEVFISIRQQLVPAKVVALPFL